MEPNTTVQNCEFLGALIQHIHELARETELTIDEWMAGVHFLNAVGAIYGESKGTRNESHRVSDSLGLESHIHIMVTHPDYHSCTSQLYPHDDQWLATDTVFAVKEDLILDFKPSALRP